MLCLWDGGWACEFLDRAPALSTFVSLVCVSVSKCAHVWVHTFLFSSAGGDPLLCQLFPMMLNSNRNIVSGENDFILWKTILPHSFISPRRPLSPLNPNSSCYSLLYSLYLYQCLLLYISGSLVLFYVHDSFSFSCRFSLFLSEA